MDVLMVLARLLLAGVFAAAGIAKLLDLAGSEAAMRGFGVPDRLAKPAGIALPVAELFFAILLLPVATAAWGGLGALLLLLAFVGGISYSLSRGRRPDCHCFGQLHSEPVGMPTLIRNGALAVVALFVAWRGFAVDPGPSLIAWIGDLSALGWVLLIGGLIMLALLAGIAWLLTHLLGQNGRLLVRMDEIESALAEADLLPEDEDEEDEEEEGLPIGDPAPAFALAGLHGERTTLDALRAPGKPVMLIFTDPDCAPCNSLLPDIGKWQREQSGKVTTAVIGRGSADENRAKSGEHGLTNILLQEDDEVAEAYQTGGTPTGVIVRPDGTIGSVPAPGAGPIRDLMKQAIAGKLPTAAPRRVVKPTPARPPAPAANLGKPAPAVELPNLSGETVKLADFQGEPTALLFWNPGCGFCSRMLPELKQWEENTPEGAPKLLVVSTGSTEDNQAMGLQSPVVLDQGFNTGRAFGASGTPSAVMVDREGNIASGISVGAPSVLGLLRNEAPATAPGNGAVPDEPATPKIGDPAPAVKLPDLRGNEIDLAEHKGTRTLVVFWNPGCGFCQQMVPDIKKWEARPPKGAPKLVLISSGSVEENEKMELRSPILLDENFSAGSAFGSDGTPSGILIDAQGNIASELAVGAPGVMKLARSTKDPATEPTKV